MKTWMSAEIREKLRLHAEAKKGRDTLMGLYQTTGLVALDHVQDRDGELPEWIADGTGVVRKNGETQALVPCFLDHTTWGVPRTSIQCPWVRLNYAPDWLKVEFCRRWEHRFISEQNWKTSPVFPLPQVCEFFAFLWPELGKRSPRMSKYMTGCSDDYTRRHPGTGSRLRLPSEHRMYPGEEVQVLKASAIYLDLLDARGRSLRELRGYRRFWDVLS